MSLASGETGRLDHNDLVLVDLVVGDLAVAHLDLVVVDLAVVDFADVEVEAGMKIPSLCPWRLTWLPLE